MKVFMINSVCGVGSTGRICTSIAAALQANGHECRIAYGRGAAPEPYRSYAMHMGSRWGVWLHGLCARVFDCAGFGSKAATRQLIREMTAYDPDVIHLHNLHGYYLDVETLFSYLKSAGKPVIWTLHDCWAFTGHCAHFDAAGCEKWRTQCGFCPERRSYPASLVLDRSASNFRRKRHAFSGLANMTLVTPSQWLARLAGASYLRGYPVEVIPNGIDTDVFRPAKGDFRSRYHLGDRYIVLGVAGAWNRRKGLDDLVALAQMLGDGYAVVVVGLTQRQRKTLPPGVIGILRTENPTELAEIYTAADVLVNPTYEDTYPTVNLEAAACGTPVITYRTGGSVESVAPDCVVERGDVEGLAEKIRARSARCREDLPLNQNIGAQSYLELYRRSLGRRPEQTP